MVEQSSKMSLNLIGTLNEYCQRKKIGEPVYTNIEQEGPTHSPTFKYQCFVKGQNFFGQGLTKKIAKENSAKSAIEELNILEEKEVVTSSFRIAQVGSEERTLKLLWDGSIDKLDIVVKKKNGEQQDFKTFYLVCN